jgi:CRISPR/Cas system-associated endonuclease Cas1
MTPKILKDANIKGGYSFLFYSNEGEGVAREAPHIHVRKGRMQAKFWLDPEVNLARAKGFQDHELRDIRRIIETYRDQILSEWEEFFGV